MKTVSICKGGIVLGLAQVHEIHPGGAYTFDRVLLHTPALGENIPSLEALERVLSGVYLDGEEVQTYDCISIGFGHIGESSCVIDRCTLSPLPPGSKPAGQAGPIKVLGPWELQGE